MGAVSLECSIPYSFACKLGGFFVYFWLEAAGFASLIQNLALLTLPVARCVLGSSRAVGMPSMLEGLLLWAQVSGCCCALVLGVPKAQFLGLGCPKCSSWARSSPCSSPGCGARHCQPFTMKAQGKKFQFCAA